MTGQAARAVAVIRQHLDALDTRPVSELEDHAESLCDVEDQLANLRSALGEDIDTLPSARPVEHLEQAGANG